MNESECIAKAVVEVVLPGSRMTFQESQSNHECDFALELPSGEVACLEVTASVDERHKEVLDVLTHPRKRGPFVTARLCQHGWYVHPEPGAEIKRIRQRVDEYLHRIELSGVSKFFAPFDAHDNPAIQRIWEDLKIEAGAQMEWKLPRQIGLAVPGQGGWVDPEHIVLTVEREAGKTDNQVKLAAVQCEQRHLFIFVDASDFDTWGPMLRELMPPRTPSLPESVTHVWVVSSAVEAHWFRVLLYSREHAWRDCGPIYAKIDGNT